VVTFDEAKRLANIKKHGLDFAGCEEVWDGPTVTREDRRADYGETRLVLFGQLRGEVVVMVYTESRDVPHIISLRRAETYEKRYYLEATKEHRP
jgi:uncharacterized DUF497 family protein